MQQENDSDPNSAAEFFGSSMRKPFWIKEGPRSVDPGSSRFSLTSLQSSSIVL